MEMAPDFRARICKSLWSPKKYTKESIPQGWESIPGLLKRFSNMGSVLGFAGSSPARVVSFEPNMSVLLLIAPVIP